MTEKCKTCTRYVNGYCALTMAKPIAFDKCDYRPFPRLKRWQSPKDFKIDSKLMKQ